MGQLASRVRDRLELVKALHISDDADSPFCRECGHSWPCATVRAIKGDDQE